MAARIALATLCMVVTRLITLSALAAKPPSKADMTPRSSIMPASALTNRAAISTHPAIASSTLPASTVCSDCSTPWMSATSRSITPGMMPV